MSRPWGESVYISSENICTSSDVPYLRRFKEKDVARVAARIRIPSRGRHVY